VDARAVALAHKTSAVALAVDSTGAIHYAFNPPAAKYEDPKLSHAIRRSGTWTIEPVSVARASGAHLAIGPGDTPYRDASG